MPKEMKQILIYYNLQTKSGSGLQGCICLDKNWFSTVLVGHVEQSKNYMKLHSGPFRSIVLLFDSAISEELRKKKLREDQGHESCCWCKTTKFPVMLYASAKIRDI